MKIEQISFADCKRFTKFCLQNTDERLLFMSYFTDGGVYRNNDTYHFRHLFIPNGSTHTAVPISDVIVKGIFALRKYSENNYPQ